MAAEVLTCAKGSTPGSRTARPAVKGRLADPMGRIVEEILYYAAQHSDDVEYSL
jgi:hypothetical protein